MREVLHFLGSVLMAVVYLAMLGFALRVAWAIFNFGWSLI